MTKVLCGFKDCVFIKDYDPDEEIGVCSKEEIVLDEAVEDDWIPVSERLPKVGEYVLASISRWGGVKHDVIIIEYMDLGEEKFWKDGTITAWKPLPEPYKESDTE